MSAGGDGKIQGDVSEAEEDRQLAAMRLSSPQKVQRQASHVGATSSSAARLHTTLQPQHHAHVFATSNLPSAISHPLRRVRPRLLCHLRQEGRPYKRYRPSCSNATQCALPTDVRYQIF